MKLMDKEAFLEKMKRTDRYFAVKFDIEEAPEIDPVHAAGGCYCRECTGYDPVERFCDKLHTIMLPDDFCSYGLRKDDFK